MLSREIWLGDPTDFVQESFVGNFNGNDPGVDPVWDTTRGFFWPINQTNLGLVDPRLVYQDLGKLAQTPVFIRRLQLNLTGQATWRFELVDGVNIAVLKFGTTETSFYSEDVGTLTPGQKVRLLTTGGTSHVRMVVTLELATRRLLPSALVGTSTPPVPVPGSGSDDFVINVGRNGLATGVYLRTSDGVLTNISPVVLPFDATLIAMSASSASAQTWTAEVHLLNVLVTGATLGLVTASSAYRNDLSINLNAGDKIEVFCNGVGVDRPDVNLVFRRR